MTNDNFNLVFKIKLTRNKNETAAKKEVMALVTSITCSTTFNHTYSHIRQTCYYETLKQSKPGNYLQHLIRQIVH